MGRMFDPTPPPTSPTAPSITIHALLVDFRVLVLLFVFLRLLMLMAYPPVGTQGALGLTVGGDRLYHYQLAQLSANGDLPFRDWWSEFPPVWPGLGVLIFRGLGNAPFAVWTAVISVILLLFDVGNLWLVRAIGSRAYGRPTGVAVAWCYALLALPVIQLFWHFETMAAFWMLLGLWWLTGQRDVRAGIAIALGALTKFTPALLLGAALRYRPPHKAVLIILIAVLIFAGAYGLLLVGNPNPEVTLTSLTAQFRKASYGSVWALIDGNLSAGELAFPGDDAVLLHYDLAAASTLYGQPPRVPAWLRLGVALMVGAFCFIRARRSDTRAVIAFVLLTLLIFFIQAQGWSPHWLVQILPLTLLCFPTRAGVLVCLALSALSILETPLLFTRIATEGALVIDFGLLTLYAFSIVTRTAIMVGMCAALYRVLRGR
jgi:hypothetical protein